MSASAFIKRYLHWQFGVLQRLGVDVLPRHFYSEIPDLGRLRSSAAWRKAFSLTGVNGADSDSQLAFARTITAPAPLKAQGDDIYARACAENGAVGYGPIEAQFLYAYVLAKKPARIIQIGAGVSTSLILQAAQLAGYVPRITCIDPFPTSLLKRFAAEGKIELLAEPVEAVDPEMVCELSPGDLLFIDSTHTLGPAGEVTRLILEWLPRTPVGVQVHFHDIHFPYDYPTDILDGALFFQHETALLLGFLTMNSGYRILASLAMLHHARPAEFYENFAACTPRRMRDGVAVSAGVYPSAVYLERIA